MAESKNKTTSGMHGVHQYVRLLCTLYQQRKSGLLSIESGRNVQQFLLVEGSFVSAKSIKPFHRRLVEVQQIDEEEWSAAQAASSDVDTVGDILLGSGAIARAEIQELQDLELRNAIKEPLAWDRGHWRFQEKEEWTANRIDPALRIVNPTLLILWDVIGPYLDDVFGHISSMLIGHLQLDQEAKEFLSLLNEGALYDRLIRILEDGMGLNVLLQKYPTMRPIICFLFLLGSLRSTREKKVEEDVNVASVRIEEGLLQKNISIIRSDYRRRMQKDYYSFLKVSPDLPQAQLERSVRRLQRRWSGYQDSVRNEPDVLKKLSELLLALQQITTCFSDPAQKREYDRMYRFGRAPLVLGQGVSVQQQDPLEELRLLVQKGQYEEAQKRLKDRQSTVGLSADILAELGWCQWNLGARAEAQDSIRLALGLDAHHISALEYDARIAISVGEPMKARKRLVLLLQLRPEHEWGQETLVNIDQKENDRE
jgi:tetratricopeptide (TPR) repeat protein